MAARHASPRRFIRSVLLLTGAAATAGVIAVLAAPGAHAQQRALPQAPAAHKVQATASPGIPCPADVPAANCVRGKVVIQDPSSDTLSPDPNQIEVLDKSGAPMFWVNVGGAASGGTPVCVVSLTLKPEACLGGPMTPSNDQGAESAVTPYGPDGTNPQTLTYADLTALLKLVQS